MNTHWLKALLTCFVMATGISQAQAFPDKPVRIIVPAAAGGGADTLARLLAQHMGSSLGQPVLVENRAGAGGNLAAEAVARAPKDGYTLLLGDNAQLAINPSLYASVPFDPLTDFTPIARVASFPFLLLAHPDAGIRSVADVLAKARAKPGMLAYASAGVGTPQHLGGELMAAKAGVQLLHVPYRGGAPALKDLLAGQVPIGFVGIPPTLVHVQKGSLLALAVSSAKRSPALPDVPTMEQAGVPDYDAVVWFGILAPAGVPDVVVQRLADTIRDVMGRAAVREKLLSMGYEPSLAGPVEFARYMRSESLKWQELVRKSGATAN